MPNSQVTIFARRFRDAAKEFREFPDSGRIVISHIGKDAEGKPCKIITGVRTEQKLQEVCGIWLIEARKQKLIPDDQAELIRLIDECITPFPRGEPLQTDTLMRKERCPYNLFLALCAGGSVEGRIVEQNERAELIPIEEKRDGRAWPNPGRFVTCNNGMPVEVFTDGGKRYREVGGLMESVAAGAVERRPMERNAELCEWVADLLESTKLVVADEMPTPAIARGKSLASVSFAPLKGWSEIFKALNDAIGHTHLKNVESTRDFVLNLNINFDGPIIKPQGRGNQPTADKFKLLAWWNSLGERWESLTADRDAKADDKRHTVADSYNHGKSGTVVPGIAGSQKQRKQPEKGKGPKRSG